VVKDQKQMQEREKEGKKLLARKERKNKNV